MRRTLFSKLAKGFTLIELLIVIGIIAILTVAFLPTLRGGQSKARDAARVALLSDLSVALEKAIDENKTIPEDTAAGNGGDCITSYAPAADGTATSGSTLATYLGRVPQSFTPSLTGLCATNPSGNAILYTKQGSSGYLLGIELENFGSANVANTKTAANLKALISNESAIAATATPPTDGVGDAGKYYYILWKGL